MILLAAALALQAQPGLARTWRSAVGLADATLALGAGGGFTATFRPKGKPPVVVRGTYAVGPVPSSAKRGRLKNARMVLFLYDLASLGRIGVPASKVAELRRAGKSGEVGMQLYYVPEFPLLSDLKRFHFVDAKDRAGASKRLLKWRPF